MQTLIFILSINTPFKLNLIYNQQPTKMEFTAKKKGGHDFGRLAIFNSVTLSTIEVNTVESSHTISTWKRINKSEWL